MVKILIDGHPKIDIGFYIKKLIEESICIDHTVPNDIIYSEFHPLNYLQIAGCTCCTNKDNIDENLYVHNCSPYTYKEIHDYHPENMSSWTPDIIIYIYVMDYEQWNPSDLQLNFNLDIIYDDLTCSYPIYKINGRDEPQHIYACICDIIMNI